MDNVSALSDLHTIRDFIRWGASRMNEAGLFFGHGTANAIDEAAYLVFYALHLPVETPADYLACCLTRDEKQVVIDYLRKRIEQRLPAAYVTNEAWFAGHPFYVDPRVLVPRSPVAELIDSRFLPWVEDPDSVVRILDLCTGSGCIGIASAHAFPKAQVDCCDISEAALEVAELNVVEHDVSDRVAVIHSDLFSALEGQRYDLIVSNPPYVSVDEYESLPEEYLHEPRLGLAAGSSGMEIVQRILWEASDYLNDQGVLVVEAGANWPLVTKLWPEVPFAWPAFKRGGEGVFVLTAEQLRTHRQDFSPS